ncbi:MULTISPECIES: EAL domain-containing protein [Halomonadaceae]|uniref:bifunctional diguanylate cyclase/phosphodiesterase n=1 Tax=Halomonadaceae TaxID=28256 RepID=UPI000344EB57|nr:MULTISPECIES: EAL domain-containing protein [Halomonas]MCD1584508.1 EAL domain-containing protein [Halomonas sp. IOP_14]MCE7518159.1 EAL domain-containing protein [Halomonas titanicae]NAO95327.1 EAL domain-containing protein [Halomonas sp. MG34]NVE90504.1 EAL domain-containing protein [Halomonas titanicae]|tara:strand:- start:1107 stop:3947 length:2841 start_codon:yes stop_codon:yes gene_type:complete
MKPFTLFRTPQRLSLTWRVIALSSLLLLALVTLFTWLGHDNLTRQFQESRSQHYERQQREIRLALVRSSENLRQLAGLTAASASLGSPLQAGNTAAVEQALDSQWPALQLEAGIDEILIINTQGQVLGNWGTGNTQTQLPILSWIRRVMHTEQPLTTLRCSASCQQFAAVPVLVAGESVGMVVLTRSLADVTRQAKEVSGSEVALLVTGPTEDSGMTATRELKSWNGQLLALTSEEQTLAPLQRASDTAPVRRLMETPLNLEHDGRHLELSAVRMEEDNERSNIGYLLLISDITEQIKAINQDTRTLLFVGVLGWIAAELLLLVILLGPMARLRRVAGLLPALADGKFSDIHAAIPNHRRRIPDEIDVLESITLELSRQLELLESEVQERGDQLAVRIGELAKERDFVNGLLDTAQVFIIAQDDTGRISLVNEYTQLMLGLNEASLLGRHFVDVFEAGASTKVNTFSHPQQEEKTLRTPDHRTHTIAWYHAPLQTGNDGKVSRISVGLDITERKAAEARLTWLAERDPLTELYNRRFFQHALQTALERPSKTKGAVLLLDLNQFKEVNELSGHHVGDKLLREVADTLFRNLGPRGVIARLGGDEFSLLLEDTNADQAISVAQYIVQLLDGIGFVVGERRHRVTASIGIALFPTHGNTPADLMASADVAMYKAKESGLQHWHLLSKSENAKDELQARVYWVERIHNALEEDSFELMVQPIMRLEDQDVKHHEVLLRMRDADGSLISPAHFIPIAEQSGQIILIDRWVLRHSLKALSQLQDRGITLAVNLSGQSLHDGGLKQYLADELTASGADPHHLILEVTETAAVTDFSTARGVLQAVRDLGCRTALDDFGVGFSSFHYLGQLPVDYIKIDGSFIRSLLISPDSRVIVRAIADIAKGFGKQTIAEFVDQEALLPILKAYGITYGQGFHLGRPIKIIEAFSGISAQ